MNQRTDVDERTFGSGFGHGFHAVVRGEFVDLVFASAVASRVEDLVDFAFDEGVFDVVTVFGDEVVDLGDGVGNDGGVGVGGGNAVGDAGAERVLGEPVIDHALDAVDKVGNGLVTVVFPDAVDDAVVGFAELCLVESSLDQFPLANEDGLVRGGAEWVCIVFGFVGVDEVVGKEQRHHLLAGPEAHFGCHDGGCGNDSVPVDDVHHEVHHFVAGEEDVTVGEEVGPDECVLDDADDGFVRLCGAKVFGDGH